MSSDESLVRASLQHRRLRLIGAASRSLYASLESRPSESEYDTARSSLGSSCEPERQSSTVSLSAEDAVEPVSKGASCLGAAMIVMGETLGTGVMALPKACSHLGWLVGFASLIMFGLLSFYSGLLLARVREAYPEVTSYADAAAITGGYRFQQLTHAAILVYWGLILPYYVIGCASSLYTAFEDAGLCFYAWLAVVGVLLLAPLQIRTLHELSSAATASCAAAGISLVAILVVLSSSARQGSTTVVPPSEGFMEGYGNISSLIFAFQGQSMFLEVMHDMRDPKQFVKSIAFASTMMTLLYAATVAVSYVSDPSWVYCISSTIISIVISLLLLYCGYSSGWTDVCAAVFSGRLSCKFPAILSGARLC